MSSTSDQSQSSYQADSSASASFASNEPQEGVWDAQETVPKEPISMGISTPLCDAHMIPNDENSESNRYMAKCTTEASGPPSGFDKETWKWQNEVTLTKEPESAHEDQVSLQDQTWHVDPYPYLPTATALATLMPQNKNGRRVDQSQQTDSDLTRQDSLFGAGSVRQKIPSDRSYPRLRIPSGDLGSLYDRRGSSKFSSTDSNDDHRAFQDSLESDSYPEIPEARNRASDPKYKTHYNPGNDFPKFSFKKFDGKLRIPKDYKGRVEVDDFKGEFEALDELDQNGNGFWRQPMNFSMAHIQWMIINLLLILCVISWLFF